MLGEQHHKLWDLTKEILRGIVQADQFASTEQRINGFRSGHGTVLYFEDMTVIEGLQASFPSYSEHFPSWSQQSNGMLQFVIWTALENEGLGASVQHYNPLIDEKSEDVLDHSAILEAHRPDAIWETDGPGRREGIQAFGRTD